MKLSLCADIAELFPEARGYRSTDLPVRPEAQKKARGYLRQTTFREFTLMDFRSRAAWQGSTEEGGGTRSSKTNMCRRPLLGGPVHKLGANSVGRRRLKVGSQPVGAKATAFKLIQVSIVCLYAVYLLSTTCCLYAVYTLSMPLDSKVLSICC